MPTCDSTHFDQLEYNPADTIDFAEGLPGFESERHFVVVQQPVHHPLVFLQSLLSATLCFPALPACAIDPSYRPHLSPADLEQLGFVSQPDPNQAVVLALIAVHEENPTVNLLAPIVINLLTRAAAQCIDPGQRYSHRHSMVTTAEAVAS